MYSTCLYCNGSLGTNEVLEVFPVGRRLAFDPAKGRLWVVCRRCERWNLSPLEERWEAIETCERLYRETRLRASTDNIGLARVREGLELVRIGPALRPEFAAWRYGDQFGRRRRRHLLYTAAGGAILAGVVIAGPATGLIAGGSWALINVSNTLHNVFEERRVRVRLVLPSFAQPLVLRRKQLKTVSLVPSEDALGWSLALWSPRPIPSAPGESHASHWSFSTIVISGDEAVSAAGKILPQINAQGARKGEVQSAVRLIEDVGDGQRLFADWAKRAADWDGARSRRDAARLHAMPVEVRLALEMASHEESERRALAGELALLEAEWRIAEEIAAIADDLLLPPEVDERLRQSKAAPESNS